MKEELKGKTDKSTSIVGDFNTSLLVINGTSKKISKKVELNNARVQQELTDINRTLNPTLVSNAHRTVTKTEYIINHK